MKAEINHGGLYLIHDINDVVVRYDIVSNTFKSDYYEYPLAFFNDNVCATDGDRFIFVKPIPLAEEILKANGFIHKDTMNEWWHEVYDPTWGMQMSDFELTDEFMFGRAKITYVHELQCMLRLCGLNELANNIKIQ